MDTSKKPFGSLPIIPPKKVQRNLATTRLLMVGYGEREFLGGEKGREWQGSGKERVSEEWQGRESVSEGGRWNTDQLVGNVSVVSACHTLTNGRLHQTRERWKHIDRWVYL